MVSTSDTGKSLAALSLDLWCSSLARKGWGVHWQVPIYLLAMFVDFCDCLLYTSPSPRDKRQSRMPSSA